MPSPLDVRVRAFLADSVYMMVLAFIIGFLFGFVTGGDGFGRFNSQVAMLSLATMMSFSLCNLQFKGLKMRDHLKTVATIFLLTFVLSSGVTILLAYLFEGAIRSGWILIAAVPSAISVIPYTHILKGDLETSLVASTAVYIIALLVTPLITFLFLGAAIGPMTVLYYIVALIVLPLVISRLLTVLNLSREMRTIIINIGFFVLVLSVVGANWDVFFGSPLVVLGLIMVALIRTFGVGGAVEWYSRKIKIDRKRRAPFVLFSTYKNAGMAAALGMTLLASEAAIPAAVCMTVEVIWFIALKRFLYPELQSTEEINKDGIAVLAPR